MCQKVLLGLSAHGTVRQCHVDSGAVMRSTASSPFGNIYAVKLPRKLLLLCFARANLSAAIRHHLVMPAPFLYSLYLPSRCNINAGFYSLSSHILRTGDRNIFLIGLTSILK